MKKQYYFHADPGHAWLAVKRKELIRLGIINQISSCSYQKGETVYLEEDRDAGLFMETKQKAREPVVFKETYQDNTPIRNYPNFIA